MKFLKVSDPKTVKDLLDADVKQAEKVVADYKEAISDVQGKIKGLVAERKELRKSLVEVDNRIEVCSDEAARLMEAMTEVLNLISGYKGL
jgi:uncharacterized coiled-coil DUF342 family protein